MALRLWPTKRSGTKVWTVATADDEKELLRMAEKLKVPLKNGNKGRVPHLDLSEHQRELARRYGAVDGGAREE
jgi:hypothetical protein